MFRMNREIWTLFRMKIEVRQLFKKGKLTERVAMD